MSNTILFTNLAFIIDKIESNETSGAIFISTILVLAILVLYKKIKQDLMTFKCIRKRFPDIIKSRNLRYDVDN